MRRANTFYIISGLIIVGIIIGVTSCIYNNARKADIRLYQENIEQGIQDGTGPSAAPTPGGSAASAESPTPAAAPETAAATAEPTGEAATQPPQTDEGKTDSVSLSQSSGAGTSVAGQAAAQQTAAPSNTSHYIPTGVAQPVSESTALMGDSQVTAEQMYNYLKSVNPSAPNYAQIYLDEGAAEGVRGDIAFAQSCVETGHWQFGNDVSANQNNFSGIGATGGGAAGNSFATPELGIRAQIQHLQAYASTAPLKNECVDPRYTYVTRGCATTIAGLEGKWAASGSYASQIVTIMNKIIAFGS